MNVIVTQFLLDLLADEHVVSVPDIADHLRVTCTQPIRNHTTQQTHVECVLLDHAY